MTSLAVPFVFELPRSLLDVRLFCALGFFGGFGHFTWLGAAIIIASGIVVASLGRRD